MGRPRPQEHASCCSTEVKVYLFNSYGKSLLQMVQLARRSRYLSCMVWYFRCFRIVSNFTLRFPFSTRGC